MSAAYLFLLSILLVTGVLVLVALPGSLAQTRRVEIHTILGHLAFLPAIALTFAHLKRFFSARWAAAASACFVLYVWFSLTPTPSMLAILAAVAISVAVCVGLVRRGAPPDRPFHATGAVLLIFAFAAFCSGLFPTLGGGHIRFSKFYRTVHGPLGLSLFPLLFLHLAPSWAAVRRLTDRRPLGSLAALLAASTVILVSAFAVPHPSEPTGLRAQPRVFPTHTLAEGRGLEFRTMEGDPLGGSAECGACHQTVFRQWAQSLHANAGKNLGFMKALEDAAAQRGPEKARECAACHDPAAAFLPDPREIVDRGRAARRDGVSCRGCHLIVDMDEKGNGMYAVSQGSRGHLAVAEENRLIRGAARPHVEEFSRPLLKQGRYCAACHRSERKTGLVPLDHYTSWKESAYADRLTCQNCHMARIEADDYAYSWMDHRFFGIARDLPDLVPEDDPERRTLLSEFSAATMQWLDGALDPVRFHQAYFDETFKAFRVYYPLGRLWRAREVILGGTHLPMEIESRRGADARDLTLVVRTRNRSVGHDFPGGPSDNLNRIWLDVSVTDHRGTEVYRTSGESESAHRLERGLARDAEGHLIERHETFLTASITDSRAIPPEGSATDSFEINVPDGATWPLTVQAAWRYKRYNDDFWRYVTGDPKAVFPSFVISERWQELASPAASQ